MIYYRNITNNGNVFFFNPSMLKDDLKILCIKHTEIFYHLHCQFLQAYIIA